MSKSQMVVADKYQLGRNGAKFSKELRHQTPERTNQVVVRDWAERMNQECEDSGIWYDIDEEATKTYYSSKGKHKTVEANVVEEIPEKLIEEYEEVFGKKPFHSWDAEKIQAKIDAKLSE